MENNLTYKTSGEFQIPDLSLRENPQSQPLGKYGRMRQTYLREHRPILWNQMILSETLFPHLREIDEAANRRLEQMMPELMTSAGVTEALKAADPLKWAGLMNTCKAQAEEVILAELKYRLCLKRRTCKRPPLLLLWTTIPSKKRTQTI